MRKTHVPFGILTAFTGLVLAASSANCFQATNAVPWINQPLVPAAAAPGSAGLTLIVSGTGFTPGSVINWNGVALSTLYVSPSRLSGTVPASNLTLPGSFAMTVTSPAPGGGTSNPMAFEVTNPTTSIFFSGPLTTVGNSPFAEATGDFNGDGYLDLVAVNNLDNTVSILLGNGKGTFSTKATYITGSGPRAVAVGDFTGSGKLDLAVVNRTDDDVAIFLGNGDGTFLAPVTFAVGTAPRSVVTGDFNDDGKLDLAVSNVSDNTISILLGNGDGTFQTQIAYATASGPSGLAIGDFNRDGQLDLATAVTGANAVSILLGKSDGSFGTHTEFPTGVFPDSVAVADLNGDQKLDLAVANQDSSGIGAVSVLLGNGDGTFQATVNYLDGQLSSAVTIGDLNGDGVPDLAVSNYTSQNITELLGNGNGTFQTALLLPLGYPPSSVTLGDFNGDGRLDMIAGNESGNSVSVLLQTPIVPTPTSISFGNQVVGKASPPQMVTVTNNGQQPVSLTSLFLEGTNAADFNGSNTCPASLASGASCAVTLRFRPPAVGTFSAELALTDNAPGSPQTIPLSGSGTVFQVSPTALNFGGQKVGTTSLPLTITLTNLASGPELISSITVTGTRASNYAISTNTCGTSIGGKSSCMIGVTFTPAAKGEVHANVQVVGGGGAPILVVLSGNGT